MRGADNIIAALGRNDRIREMSLFDFQSSQFEKVSAAMQQPFPSLTDLALELELEDESAQVVPASFPGGSAPRLQTLTLYSFPFPGLPKLLLSATHLVDLDLWNIPDAGYISPTEMVICLSVLTGFEKLELGFESPLYPPDRRIRPPPTRAFLPVLTGLRFFGVCGYLEDIVAWIDAPLLDNLAIIFFHRLMFTTPKLAEFISRTPKFEPHNEALVVFSEQGVSVTLLQTFDGLLELGISCRHSEWQLSSLAQVCSSSLPRALFAAVEHLYILENRFRDWQDDIENSQWLEVLHLFTAVKGLYISSEFTPRIAPALQELVGERVKEVLPTLQSLFLEEPLPSRLVRAAIEDFVAAQQFSSHLIAVSRWKRKSA